MSEPTPSEILFAIHSVGTELKRLTRAQTLTRKALLTVQEEVSRIAQRQMEFADDTGRRLLALERRVFPSEHPNGAPLNGL